MGPQRLNGAISRDLSEARSLAHRSGPARAGWNFREGLALCTSGPLRAPGGATMNNIIYLVGLVVIVLAILSFFGFR